MNRSFISIILFIFFGLNISAQTKPKPKIRQWTDTNRFVSKAWQIDTFIRNVERLQGDVYQKAKAITTGTGRNMWGVAICPHDAYSYVGYLYPAILSGVTAKHLLLIGTVDKNKDTTRTNKLIFDSFSQWQTPMGKVPVSDARDAIMRLLPDSTFCINDNLQQYSSSLEALLPFILYYGKDRDIIPVLVPAMFNAKLQGCAMSLADALAKVLTSRDWIWGKDFAIIIAGDAVSYGDQEIPGESFSPYGIDSSAYGMAMNYDYDLINTYLTGPMMPMKAGGFTLLASKKEDFHVAKWPWSGRFSIPFGLYTAYYLRKKSGNEVRGFLLGYETSLSHPLISVGTLKINRVPEPSLRKWVGYTAIGYR